MYARYVHVPIGNVPEDLSMLAADVFYARHLLKQNHVLWASNAPAPDLGGKEEDDHRLTSSEQDHVLSLNFPAAYNTVCVEVSRSRFPEFFCLLELMKSEGFLSETENSSE